MKYSPLFFDPVCQRWRRVVVGDIDELTAALEDAALAKGEDDPWARQILELPPLRPDFVGGVKLKTTH